MMKNPKFIKILLVTFLGVSGVFLPLRGYASSLNAEVVNYSSVIESEAREYQLTYTVEKADTLWEIAKRMGISIDELIRDNRIHSPDMIFPGDRLILPVDKDLPLRFEVAKLETSDQGIRVIFPNKYDVTAPLVPVAYFPTENSNAFNYKFKVSITFDLSVSFFQWLLAQEYNGNSTSKTVHNSTTSPKPLNLIGVPAFTICFPEGEPIQIDQSCPNCIFLDISSPPPKFI